MAEKVDLADVDLFKLDVEIPIERGYVTLIVYFSELFGALWIDSI